jgi:tetratricopeptide (TPR) repeat protein
MWKARLTSTVLCCAAFGLGVLPASAAPKGYESQYALGLKYEKAGSYVEALAAFSAIPPEKRDWLTRNHIANLQRKLGRFKEAKRSFEEILANTSLDPSERDTTRSDLDDLLAKMPKVRIAAPADAADVTVTFDDAPVACPCAVESDPGPHVVRASRGGSQFFERRLELTESSTVDVVVTTPPARAEPPTPKATSVDAPPTQKMSESRSSVGFIIGAAGLVSLANGTFFTVRTVTLRDRRDSLARDGDVAAANEADADAWTALTIARISMATGLLAAGTGAALVIASWSSPAKQTVQLRPTVGLSSWGIQVGGAW